MADGPAGASGRIPPHDLNAERAVLGGVLLENAAYNVVAELPLRPEDFYRDSHAKIYEAMIELFANSQPVDSITLREKLATSDRLAQVGGEQYLLSLTDTIPTIGNIEAHARIVHEKAIVRRMIQTAHEIAATGYTDYGNVQEYVDGAERTVFNVSRQHARSPFERINQVMMRTFDELTAASQRKDDHITGLPTGFTALDWYTAGLHPGDLVICAGRPGMGKTAFALNLATNACKARGKPVLFFSLEMSKDQLARRLLCAEALVDGNKLRSARLGRGEWQQLTRAAGVVSELPLWIDDTPGITLMEMRAKARRLRAEGDLALIVVDYLQLMRSGGKHDNREQEISEISRSLKGIAKELRIPVIALSQLNRAVESRGTKDKRPMLADLRESGAIEQDADTILFVFREEVYDPENAPQGIAEIIIGKQRAGPTGKVEVRFRPQFTRFDNIDRQHGESDAPAEPAEPANY